MAASAQAAGQDFSWPASGVVTQNAAEHRANEGGNSAIDIAAPGGGVPIVAAHDGVVQTVSIGGNTQCYSANHASNGLGDYVVLRHDGPGGTLYSAYAHLAPASASVSVGQSIGEGAQLGVMGNTGCSTG
ncbi:MAG: M23 family metallopeptidase, partial [Chloroflexi bacterium]|nr:M23 family metallopeptidase [Chloroflexota bacterium]